MLYVRKNTKLVQFKVKETILQSFIEVGYFYGVTNAFYNNFA